MKTKIVKADVLFKDGFKSYVYYTDMKKLTRGDNVVVKTINGFVVAKFLGYTNRDPHTSESYIVQKIDTTHVRNLSNLIEEMECKKYYENESYEELKERAQGLEEALEVMMEIHHERLI